jgi:hypothetical protein
MTTTAKRYEADRQFTYRALQDARQYNTDTDPTGSRAEAIYKRLAKASRLMQPWSTDGTDTQSRKAVEYLDEITSILTKKIGPASRRELSAQRQLGSKTTNQLDREINEALTRPKSKSPSTVKNYGLRGFNVSLGGNLQYRVIIERDWERGGFVAKLISEGIGKIMEPNGETPAEALAALVRDLRTGDATDQKLAHRIAQTYWG